MEVAALAVSVVALVLTVAGTLYSRTQTRTAKAALQHTIKVQQEQTQPYVFADIRPDKDQPQLLAPLVRNQGPTVALNVRIRIDPPIKPEPDHREAVAEWAISAIPPGAELVRPLMVGHRLFGDSEDPIIHAIEITAEGPHGPAPVLRYEVDLQALRHVGVYSKTMYHAVSALEKIAKNTRPPERPIGQMAQLPDQLPG